MDPTIHQRPHKKRITMCYSEDVYYDGNGNEVARERVYDDWTHNVGYAEELTEQEMEDYAETEEP